MTYAQHRFRVQLGILLILFSFVVLGIEIRVRIQMANHQKSHAEIQARISLLEYELDRMAVEVSSVFEDRWRRTDFGNYIKRLNAETGSDYPIPTPPE